MGQALQSRPLRSALARGDGGRGTKGGRHPIAKKRITTIYPRDQKALSALGCCGYVTRDQLGEFWRQKRIDSYCKDGLVERSIYSRPGAKEQDKEVFRLTSKGREFCRRHLSMSRLYCAQNPAHDLGLADRYFSLSATERESWRTESQCRDTFQEHIRQLQDQGEAERAQELLDKLQAGAISMPDAIYTTAGCTVAFEITTSNYGETELTAKEEAADALGASIEFHRA